VRRGHSRKTLFDVLDKSSDDILKHFASSEINYGNIKINHFISFVWPLSGFISFITFFHTVLSNYYNKYGISSYHWLNTLFISGFFVFINYQENIPRYLLTKIQITNFPIFIGL